MENKSLSIDNCKKEDNIEKALLSLHYPDGTKENIIFEYDDLTILYKSGICIYEYCLGRQIMCKIVGSLVNFRRNESMHYFDVFSGTFNITKITE